MKLWAIFCAAASCAGVSPSTNRLWLGMSIRSMVAPPEAVDAVLDHVRAAGFAPAAVVGTMEAGGGVAAIE